MSLYTSVYWTKRTLIVLSLILFICSGFKVFQFVSSKFTKTTSQISDYKPELGFGLIDKLTLSPLNTPPTFKPVEFKNSTLKGNFDVDNGYPLESTRVPLANVYKIQEIPIDLNMTETPRKIAKNFGFTKEPVLNGTTQTWSEGNKEFEVNGQYLLLKYKNTALRKQSTAAGDPLVISDSESMKTYFSEILRSYGVITDLENYKFKLDYINFDKTNNEFVIAKGMSDGQFLRINAERQYTTVFKEKNAPTTATYPDRLASNNYIILPINIPKSTLPKDNLVEISLFNWPLSHKDAATVDKDVQTYNIKTPKQAYQELVDNNKYLVSASQINVQGDARLPIATDELAGISRVDIFRIRLEMYEDVINTTYIQPVYVFICQAEKDGKLIELVYYVPALTDTVTK